MKDEFKNTFIEEVSELLTELESALIEVEKSPDNDELIAKIFRALHTIKGSAGMFGYDDISMFTHDIESVYDSIRNHKLKISKNIIDLTLEARDMIGNMLNATGDPGSIDEEKTKRILTSFRGFTNDASSNQENNQKTKKTVESKSTDPVSEVQKIFHINFIPIPEIFLTGTNPILLIQEIQELGKVILSGNFENIPSISELNPENCYTSWEMILKTPKGIDSIKDVFIFVDDQCTVCFEEIDNKGKLARDENFEKFEKYFHSKTTSKHIGLKKLLDEFDPFSAGDQENIPNKTTNEKPSRLLESETTSSIRVSADKLDEFVNLVGELVIIQARLSQTSQKNLDPEIISIAEDVERITWSLRDSALNIRMLPIGSTFNKFKRLVRDLSKELGKQVELTTEGAETELDKTVIEKLNDPLIHIIRNSIDHGIESPELRKKAGKPESGLVHLSASHSGGNVIIKIKDDGAGLDKEAIKNKAVSSGIVSEGAELSDPEIFSLIFAPGFSTAKKVTNVSGRGVGMDVVRKAIESLKGTIEVSSTKGEGTTITLKLPLTLAIIDGLLVKIEEDHFIIPLSSVEECIELSESDIKKFHGRNIINVRESIIPYIKLREKFRITGEHPSIEQIVVTTMHGNQIGFVVDEVLGQHQTVLKNLGRFYKNVEGVSGATILGDGTVALILDLQKIVADEELEASLIKK